MPPATKKPEDHGLSHLGERLDDAEDLVKTPSPPTKVRNTTSVGEVAAAPAPAAPAEKYIPEPPAPEVKRSGLPPRLADDPKEILAYTLRLLSQKQLSTLVPTVQEVNLWEIYCSELPNGRRPVSLRRFTGCLRLWRKQVPIDPPKPLDINIP